MKTIGLVVKADERARNHADAFEKWLESRGLAVLRRESAPVNWQMAVKEKSRAPDDLFCVFVLGGDGTFLSAVRWIGEADIPVVGVKFGEVGFLAEVVEEDLFSVATSILSHHFDTHLRMRLFARVLRDEREVASETVLNDVVINKGALARLSNIAVNIDNHYLTTYRADGLIVATPTGSTAYSLAAGGPVVHPEVPGIIMTPICPFTLTNRPLIVSEGVSITLRLEEDATDIMLTFDGQVGLPIDSRDTIVVQKASRPVRIITNPNQQYFDVLKSKLRWSGGRV